MFIKETSTASDWKEIADIAVLVDDLIITTPSEHEMNKIKGHLSKAFKMKEMGSLYYRLGFTVQSEEGRKLSQKQYIMKTIEREFYCFHGSST